VELASSPSARPKARSAPPRVQTNRPAPCAQRSKQASECKVSARCRASGSNRVERFAGFEQGFEADGRLLSTLTMKRVTAYSARDSRMPSAISKTKKIAVGILVGNIAGAALTGVTMLLLSSSGEMATYIGLPSFFAVPFLVGFVAAWYWRELNLRIRETLVHSLLCTLVSFSIAAIFFREGIVCLMILAPIFYIAVLVGALTGRVWFRRNTDRFNAYAIPALALIVLGEPFIRSPHTAVVTDEIRIAAPPVKVWPHVLAFETIPDAPDYWLFHFGLPYPIRTINGGNYVGADRACEFSGHAIFKEKIAELEPARLLTFDIIEMPKDPELIGHLDAQRGQFELRDNDDGTTTLIGRTWYSLHVRPAFYFDWWTHDIFRAVHLRVMRNVQRLAETAP
jgi:hypothetical protein